MTGTVTLNQLPAASVPPASGVIHAYDPAQAVGLRDVGLAVTAFTTPTQAAAAAPVQSVAGKTGVVTLAVADVSGACSNAAAAITGGSVSGASGSFTTLKSSSNAAVFVQNVSGLSIPNTSMTTVTGWSAGTDRSGSFNTTTGVFTAPANGYYLVSFKFGLSPATSSAPFLMQSRILVNGTSVSANLFTPTLSTSVAWSGPPVVDLIQMTAGQTLTVQAFQSSGGAIALTTTGTVTTLSIAQIP
jgi:hypothetical protein